MARNTMQPGALLLGVLAITLCYAQEPVVVRLHDAVGDTVDLAERDSLHLFPNTAGFRHAVILALPGPEFFAEVTRDYADTTGRIFLRIMPAELERIRFLIDNRAYAEQQRSDSTTAPALASFWQSIERRPLRNMAGEPAITQEVPLAPPEAAPTGEPAMGEETAPAPTEPATSAEPQAESTAVVLRLHDAVGDTIDLAERDSFRLFPNTAGFQRAVFLTVSGFEHFAGVQRTDADSVFTVYYRILPDQLKRIRFLIDYREFVADQQEVDTGAVRSLARFWEEIGQHPLPSMAREQAPTEIAATGGQLRTATIENRYIYALHGATLGSIAGGIVGSWIGLGEATACGFAAIGSYAGYKHGRNLDRRAPASLSLRNEGTNWRRCCAIGAGVPGIALGVGIGALVGSAGSSSWIPAALSGLCVTVEVVNLGYQLGRSIDRSRAY